MKKLLSLSVMLSLGLTTVTPALNAAQSQQDAVAQSQANPAHVSGWQAAKKWWQSGRNMKALNPQEQRAFNALKKKFTIGTIIAAIVAIIGGGAAYLHRKSAASVVVGHLGQELIRAAREGDETEVTGLIAAGADVNAVDIFGLTALMTAARMGRTDIVKLLLQVDWIDVNATTPSGWTALMWAVAENGNADIVKLLLKAGADRTMKNEYGETAEITARTYKRNDLADIIRDFVLPPAGQTVKSAEKKGKVEDK